MDNYLNIFSICGNKNIFQNRTMESELADVRFLQGPFWFHVLRKLFSSQKQDIEKLTPAYFIGIFLSNSLDNKPLTQYRYWCHQRQSFTSDEIIDWDIKDICRLCNFFIFAKLFNNSCVCHFGKSLRHSDILKASHCQQSISFICSSSFPYQGVR